jgi:hypothetical protein
MKLNKFIGAFLVAICASSVSYAEPLRIANATVYSHLSYAGLKESKNPKKSLRTGKSPGYEDVNSFKIHETIDGSASASGATLYVLHSNRKNRKLKGLQLSGDCFLSLKLIFRDMFDYYPTPRCLKDWDRIESSVSFIGHDEISFYFDSENTKPAEIIRLVEQVQKTYSLDDRIVYHILDSLGPQGTARKNELVAKKCNQLKDESEKNICALKLLGLTHSASDVGRLIQQYEGTGHGGIDLSELLTRIARGNLRAISNRVEANKQSQGSSPITDVAVSSTGSGK